MTLMIFLLGKNIDSMCDTVTDELDRLVIWLNVNMLSLDLKQT